MDLLFGLSTDNEKNDVRGLKISIVVKRVVVDPPS